MIEYNYIFYIILIINIIYIFYKYKFKGLSLDNNDSKNEEIIYNSDENIPEIKNKNQNNYFLLEYNPNIKNISFKNNIDNDLINIFIQDEIISSYDVISYDELIY